MGLIRVTATTDVYGIGAGETADVEDSGEAAYLIAVGWLKRLDLNTIPVDEIGSPDAKTPEELAADQGLDFSGLDAAAGRAHEAAAAVSTP